MNKKTYPRVIELLQEKADEGSVNRIVQKTGLNHNTITAYLAGRSEPSTESLEKIAKAYGKSVAWLRGDAKVPPPSSNIVDLSDLSAIKRQLWDLVSSIPDDKAEHWLRLMQP